MTRLPEDTALLTPLFSARGLCNRRASKTAALQVRNCRYGRRANRPRAP